MKVDVLKHPDNSDWIEVKRRALVTIGKSPVEKSVDSEWQKKMLRCRHSPIRYLMFSFFLTDIPYWLSVELCRHHVGIEKFVKSQRDDRNNESISRAEKPQGALVNMIVDINAESLMTLMNKRLCGCAAKEMQKLMLEIRNEVIKTNPEFKEFLIPNCLYSGGCKEFYPCKKQALYFSSVENNER